MSAQARTRFAMKTRLQNVIAAEESQEATPVLQPVQDSERDEMLDEGSKDEDMSYRSSGIADQEKWHARNSETELEAPMLEVISTEQYRIFLRKYNRDKRGIQRMAYLVTDKAKAAICRILKIEVQDFIR